jgi:hypothetical protein
LPGPWAAALANEADARLSPPKAKPASVGRAQTAALVLKGDERPSLPEQGIGLRKAPVDLPDIAPIERASSDFPPTGSQGSSRAA